MDSLIGITAGDWWRLLRRNHFDIDAPYLGRAALVTLVSLMNSRLRRREQREFGPRLAGVRIHPPVFVLGHWRNGTTLVHNLLCLDPQFAYPNLFQISHPHTCLSREAAVEKALGNAPPRKRPMDNMEITFRSPGEDEGALSVLCLYSPVLAWVFPRHQDEYDRYLTFRGVPAAETEAFKAALIEFLKKLTWRYDRPIVLKSPTHTARVRMMLELFPQARFIHVHRNPYVVFKSTRKLFETAVPASYLQRPRPGQVDEGILRRYALMYEAFFEDKPLIPPGQFCEIRFEDLERDMPGQMARVYRELRLPGFEAALPKIEAYVAAHVGYKKNEFKPLPEADRLKVAQAWRRCFQEWGYPV